MKNKQNIKQEVSIAIPARRKVRKSPMWILWRRQRSSLWKKWYKTFLFIGWRLLRQKESWVVFAVSDNRCGCIYFFFFRYTGIVFFLSSMIVFAAWMIGRCRGPPSRLIGTQNSLQMIKVANILQGYRGNLIFSSKNVKKKKQLTKFFIAWKWLIVCSQLAASPISRSRKVSNFCKFSFKKTLKLSRSFENGAAADEWEYQNHGWWE